MYNQNNDIFYQMLILFILFAYILGSIPFGYLIAKRKGIDIKKVGSGNIGATNISRALGKKYAILVGLLDFTKGTLPVFLIAGVTSNEFSIALVALAAVLGNIFSIFLKFRGGKGVSTYCGTLLILLGWKIFLVMAIVWLAYLYISKLMSLINITLALTLPVIFLFGYHSEAYFLYSLIVSGLLWYTHRENIKRLSSGTEKKLNFKLSI